MSSTQMSDAARPVLVLGMHRSGTSCLAGCLEEAGLWLGEVNRAAAFNKKGNRENRAAMDLNDVVLAAAGAAWDNPPAEPPAWSDEARARRDEILAGYPDDRVWGLKDPRCLLTLDGWLERLDPRHVGTFRHPLEVAASLQRRAEAWNGELDIEHGLALWRAYNARLLARHDDQAFPIIRYDQDADRYLDRVRGVAGDLGLPAPDAITFLDSSLRHEAADAPVPDSCLDLWNRLNALAL
ncbi:sulfotransferase family protein [Maricaulis sp. CAU 1757]